MDYQSLVTWKLQTDYLRCTPQFHGISRYDGILVEGQDHKLFFARLVFIFSITINDQIFPFALIESFETLPHLSQNDKELGFFRIKQKSVYPWEFISITSIKRGAYIVNKLHIISLLNRNKHNKTHL